MSKKKSGGLPRDTLFRNTEATEEPAQEVEETVEDAPSKKKAKPRTRRANKSRSKQVDNEALSIADSDTDEKQKTTEIPRQTYYVPSELHKQLRMLALQEERNVSDLVVEGVEWVLGKYGK